MSVLRGDLLRERRLALGPGVPDGVAEALSALGARLERLERLGSVAEPEGDEVGRWARARRPLHALVYDARGSFATGGPEALVRTMQEAWVAIREVAVGALIGSEQPAKIVLLGPPPDAGVHAEAARSALENLARTLSVEWARHGITTVLVAPGRDCDQQELAELVAFLTSSAGEYFSGCRLDLGRRPG